MQICSCSNLVIVVIVNPERSVLWIGHFTSVVASRAVVGCGCYGFAVRLGLVVVVVLFFFRQYI